MAEHIVEEKKFYVLYLLFELSFLTFCKHRFPGNTLTHSINEDLLNGTGSFRPESRSPRVVWPSFINSALKNEIWKIPLQILQHIYVGTVHFNNK